MGEQEVVIGSGTKKQTIGRVQRLADNFEMAHGDVGAMLQDPPRRAHCEERLDELCDSQLLGIGAVDPFKPVFFGPKHPPSRVFRSAGVQGRCHRSLQ